MKRQQSGEIDRQLEKTKLTELRAKAYNELITEKLSGNASFCIFQDLLEQCLEEVDKNSHSRS